MDYNIKGILDVNEYPRIIRALNHYSDVLDELLRDNNNNELIVKNEIIKQDLETESKNSKIISRTYKTHNINQMKYTATKI